MSLEPLADVFSLKCAFRRMAQHLIQGASQCTISQTQSRTLGSVTSWRNRVATQPMPRSFEATAAEYAKLGSSLSAPLTIDAHGRLAVRGLFDLIRIFPHIASLRHAFHFCHLDRSSTSSWRSAPFGAWLHPTQRKRTMTRTDPLSDHHQENTSDRVRLNSLARQMTSQTFHGRPRC